MSDASPDTPASSPASASTVRTGLSAEQNDKLDMFLAVTQLSQERDALDRMKAYNWDLNAAVDGFLAGQSAGSTVATSPQQHQTGPVAGPATPSSPASTEASGVRTTTEITNPQNPWESILRFVLMPFRMALSFVSFLAGKLMDVLGLHPPLLTSPEGRNAAQDFVYHYESKFGTNHPSFFRGTFAQALQTAGREYRFVLAYIHDGDLGTNAVGSISDSVCRNVFQDPSIIRFIQEAYVLWASSIKFSEAVSLRRALRNTNLPCLAIVRARVGNRHGELIALKHGRMEAADVLDWMQNVQRRYGMSLMSARLEAQQRETDRLLRQQQDEEFRRTLEEDRKKEQAKKEEAEREARLKMEEEQKVAETFQRRKSKSEGLTPEPAPGVECASIILRMPDGTRLARKFDKSDTLQTLFDWADIAGVEIQHALLVCSYPRKGFRYPEDVELTFESAGLVPSAMLLIEERVDDEL